MNIIQNLPVRGTWAFIDFQMATTETKRVGLLEIANCVKKMKLNSHLGSIFHAFKSCRRLTAFLALNAWNRLVVLGCKLEAIHATELVKRQKMVSFIKWNPSKHYARFKLLYQRVMGNSVHFLPVYLKRCQVHSIKALTSTANNSRSPTHFALID